MKNIYSIFVSLLLILPSFANGQEMAVFILTENGHYQTENGEDFIVIPFEGKTAHEIFQQLATNVGSNYKSPAKVMSSVEDSSIKIRAFSDDLIRIGFLGKSLSLGGYYQLEFRIRDGRVRVSAPIIEERLYPGSSTNLTNSGTYRKFSKEVKGYFKNGELKDKKKEDFLVVVSKMNSIVNSILGTTNSPEEDNW